MSEQFTDTAKERMGAVERLLKGLPGIRGYVDKELRRDADKRLRDLIAGKLEEQKQALFAVQRLLLEGKGLLWMDNIDSAVQKLQILIDRVKTAPAGYAGLFDAVRIQEEELAALHRFDSALAERVVDVQFAIDTLRQTVTDGGDIGDAIHQLTDLLSDLQTLLNKRQEAVLNPERLTDADFTGDVEPGMHPPEN